MNFNRQALDIDPAQETERIVAALRDHVRKLRRRGVVVGISGGVDSSVALALCIRAFQPQRVVALILPERDSSADSEGYLAKIVLPPNLLDDGALNVFSVTVVAPDGKEQSKPLPTDEFLQIMAASNFKQRTRMSFLYYYAERHHFAVVGTANKNEHDMGFFVKYGDAGVDINPLAHLYKTQIYQLARHLRLPQEVLTRPPTSDTYSAPCTQEEFFFRLPFATLDLLWYAYEHGVPVPLVAEVMELTETQVQHAFDDFARKYATTEYLRRPPQGIP